MRFSVCLLALVAWGGPSADFWFTRTAPILLAEEKKAYLALQTQAERETFQKAVWIGKSLTEAQYMERLAYVDSNFGSGRTGSGFNTDQGRMYLALGPPNSIHRLPSSRIFYASEVWYYDHVPQTGYRSRLQFLFYKPRNIGFSYKLYSPQLDTIRALLVPQPGTRGMFPINDIISAQDIRTRLTVPPAEDEVIEAAIGVAKGVTGTENGLLLAKAMSPSEMLRRDPKSIQPQIRSTFAIAEAPEVRVLQFWVDGEIPAVDIQVRVKAAAKIGLAVEENTKRLEQSEIPLGLPTAKSVVYIQRFFLLPGPYTLIVEADGNRSSIPIKVSPDRSQPLIGEGLEERPGELRIANTPDPRSATPRQSVERQLSIRRR